MKDIVDCDEIPDDCKVVIKFYADWCLPCVRLDPAFEILSKKEEYSKLLFLKVNIDQGQEIAEKFSVFSIPCVLFIDNDDLVNQCGGNIDEIIECLDLLCKVH